MEKSIRKSGALLHISSLGGRYGIGSLGEESYKFVDFLSESGMSIWQVLPLVPIGLGNSPYQSVCASALNPYFIDLDILQQKGLLTEQECSEHAEIFEKDNKKVDFDKLASNRFEILRLAYERFDIGDEQFQKFLRSNESYSDYALFMALKIKFNGEIWTKWSDEYKNCDRVALNIFYQQNLKEVNFWEWTQFEFLEQWNKLKRYANSKEIKIMGDMPLYVAYDSVEVWAHSEMFLLDSDKKPTLVAGVPPDYFSKTGQLWGNPLYDWEQMRSNDFEWWSQRIYNAFELFDLVRVDHFRGLDRYYAVAYGSANAMFGEWKKSAGIDLFKGKLHLGIVAEDLGIIDDGVRELLKQTNFPGMRVLEFGFDGKRQNENKPSNFKHNCFAYTGTHDNAPIVQYLDELSENERKIFVADLASECAFADIKCDIGDEKAIAETLIKLLYHSVANNVILPIQDILLLGKDSRMNLPGTMSNDNWGFRLVEIPTSEVAKRLQKLGNESNRSQEISSKKSVKEVKKTLLQDSENTAQNSENSDMYFENGVFLGCRYSKDSVFFRLWTNGVDAVTLRLYKLGKGGDMLAEYPMQKRADGYFERTLEGEYKNIYYTYFINGVEVIDPYAKTAGVNGIRAMIVDFDDTNPLGWENDNFNAPMPIIWEVHVRDFSIDSYLEVKGAGKFEGFQTNIKTKKGMSALVDYVKELGVTYIQLLPTADFVTVNEEVDTQRNWGYDPQNYNFPEGSYSCNPYDGATRIREFKQLVQTLHDNNIGVVMDVVYNHTYTSYGSSLEVVGRGYYYRKNGGEFYNASGCGNEIATENKMVRKFIIDSLCYWVEEYHVDGFRFDLMGAFDVETMNIVRERMNMLEKKLGKTILTYGEPWSALPVAPWVLPANRSNISLLDEKIAVFNDSFRDGLRGNNSPSKGFLQGEVVSLNAVVSGIEGGTELRDIRFLRTKSPTQQINYMSAHDNYTLFDQLDATMYKNGINFATKMGAFIIFSSLGIPFFQAGEEFLRTKYMDCNSYHSSDSINKLDWRQREKNNDMAQYYAGLIDIRRHNHVFSNLATAKFNFEWLDIRGEFTVLAYRVGEMIYCINPTQADAYVDLKRFGKLRVLINNDCADFSGTEVIDGDIRVLPKSLLCVLILGEVTRATGQIMTDTNAERLSTKK